MIKYLKGKSYVYGTGYYVLNSEGLTVAFSQDKIMAKKIDAIPDLLEALKILIVDIKEYIEECGPCDHSVGICCCGLKSDLFQAENAIQKANE